MDDVRKKLEALLQGKKINESQALPEEAQKLDKSNWQRHKIAQDLAEKEFNKGVQRLNPFADAPVDDVVKPAPEIKETVGGRKRYNDFMQGYMGVDEQKAKDLDMLMRKKQQEQAEYEDIAAEFDRPKQVAPAAEMPAQQKANLLKQLPSGPMDMSDPEQVSRFQDIMKQMSGKK